MFEYVYLFYLCNRLRLIKICLCGFLDIHLYSNILSTIATISSLNMSEFLPACFSCNNNFNLSKSLSGSDDKNTVFETPEEETIKPAELGNFISVLSRVDFLPIAFRSKFISFAKSYNNFLSDDLARSTLQFLLVVSSKNLPLIQIFYHYHEMLTYCYIE